MADEITFRGTLGFSAGLVSGFTKSVSFSADKADEEYVDKTVDITSSTTSLGSETVSAYVMIKNVGDKDCEVGWTSGPTTILTLPAGGFALHHTTSTQLYAWTSGTDTTTLQITVLPD